LFGSHASGIVPLPTALGGLHEKGLIHKNVKPPNVLVNPATGQVRLMGFGIASRLPREMVGKLSRLPARTQEALQQLACLGNSADLTTLALVRRTSEDQVRADLWEAVRLELIERLDGAFRFVHDRIQEAAYSLISEPLRADAHLQIGRLLVAHTPRDKREEVIFEIVNQLNRGAALVTSQAEEGGPRHRHQRPVRRAAIMA
jgi:predicted ATPase